MEIPHKHKQENLQQILAYSIQNYVYSRNVSLVKHQKLLACKFTLLARLKKEANNHVKDEKEFNNI